ncbi:MAG: aminotransferase class III-fold pyridoxal phosphate-dependent enzyme [Candidatus Latescibacteria bacterium]|nr:aminotransferase class III-fold pyridoxal phosphate-dependent enzyme [Candidatus Latescibacterota bacterium]
MSSDTPNTDPIEDRYRYRTGRSLSLFEAGRSVHAGAPKGAYYYPPYPLFMERGEGCHLWCADGHQYLDCANHHTTQILGHNHPAVLQATRDQIDRGIALGAATGIETETAREIVQRVPSLERIRFTNSGTEATLHAVRLARGFSKKPKIAKFEGGYHGTHDGVEVSVAPPLDLAGASQAPRSVASAGGQSPGAPGEVVVLPYDDAAAVERLIESYRDELACLIYDPKAGILPQRREFARAVRQITRKHNILLIFDEIVGYRMGPGGLQEYLGIEPDLSCFGKIVGGGFPVGAFGGRADIMDLFDNSQGPTGFFQSGTFSAHPVTMAAGLATLQQLTPEAYAHLNSLGTRLGLGLTALFARKQIAARAVITGSVFSIHFTDQPLTDYRSLAQTDTERAHRVFLALLNQGYFLSQGLGMCALSTPMQADDIDALVEAVEQALDQTG